VIALIYYIPYLNDRFYKELLIDIKPLENGTFINYNSAEPRYERWRGGFDLVRRSPLFGYGTGDEIAMLKTEYIKRGLYISYLENFNAHNQYLSLMLKHGAAGFIVFICSFLYMLRLAFRHRDFIYISFILLLLIGFYTENLLDSNKGIVFFAYFNTFLAFIILNERNARQNDAIGAKLP
jgi:O-antigen ligase